MPRELKEIRLKNGYSVVYWNSSRNLSGLFDMMVFKYCINIDKEIYSGLTYQEIQQLAKVLSEIK